MHSASKTCYMIFDFYIDKFIAYKSCVKTLLSAYKFAPTIHICSTIYCILTRFTFISNNNYGTSCVAVAAATPDCVASAC